ncbi:hypothetical protein M446_4327 [Methylobacterium sp. 4-46]|nr:hypothetical protein M446_4327 [Methylobacterium sp. 4-46]
MIRPSFHAWMRTGMSPIEHAFSDPNSLAAAGEAALNEALSRLPQAEREAYWASVRRCYNAPYNDAPGKGSAPLLVPARPGAEMRAG